MENFIFNDLSADSSIRHSFHFMESEKKKNIKQKQKQKVPKLQKNLLPLLLIWVIHFPRINAIAFLWLPQRHHGKSE